MGRNSHFRAPGNCGEDSIVRERVFDRSHDRTEDDDQDRRQETEGERKEDFDRNLGGLLASPLPALVPHFVRLRLENPTNGQAEGVRLGEHHRKRHQVVYIGTELHILEGVASGETELHLSQGETELIAHG